MGTDIHGAIEQYNDRTESYYYLGDLGWLVGRNYDAFGCLFGVRNSASVEPLFDDRGFPDEMSWKLERRIKRYTDPDVDGLESLVGGVSCHSVSYVWSDEIEDVDWSEAAAGLDDRFSVFDADREPTGSKFGWSAGLDDLTDDQLQRLHDGEMIEWGDDRYLKRRQLTRRAAIAGSWEWVLEELIPVFETRYGNGNIRLTVWFDN